MNYVNGGVNYTDGSPVPTKKALKEAIKIGLGVRFYPTAVFVNGQYSGYIEDVPVGTSLSIVGPDPYNKRSCYAQVSKSKEGKVKVS